MKQYQREIVGRTGDGRAELRCGHRGDYVSLWWFGRFLTCGSCKAFPKVPYTPKLKRQQVEQIRGAFGLVSGRSLAASFGVTPMTISHIWNGKTHRDPQANALTGRCLGSASEKSTGRGH